MDESATALVDVAYDTLLRGGIQSIDISVGADKWGGMTARAGWDLDQRARSPAGLLASAAQLGLPEAPEVPVCHVRFASSVLVDDFGYRLNPNDASSPQSAVDL